MTFTTQKIFFKKKKLGKDMVPAGARRCKLLHGVGPALSPGGQPCVPCAVGHQLRCGEGRGHSLRWPRPFLFIILQISLRVEAPRGGSLWPWAILWSGSQFS